MKKIITLLSISISVFALSQQKIDSLQYARTSIKVPAKCVAKSEYEILDCNGFSAQWIFLTDEMLKQKVGEQIFSQFESQIKFKSKKTIEFLSQNQPFRGNIYLMKNGATRIVAAGKVNDISLVLNLGFDKKVNNNKDLNEFEQKFIVLK